MHGGLARRRVQMMVISLVVLVSTGACVLALALVVDSSAPFDQSFAAQRGAHVVASIGSIPWPRPPSWPRPPRLPEVTAAAGPFAARSPSRRR